jgi:hypothetical protein
MRAGSDTDGRLDALAATEAARLLNQAGAPRLPRAVAAIVHGPTPAVGVEHAEWLEAEAERAVDAVKRTGCVVLGDVTDLRPATDALTDDPARVTPPPEAVVAAQTSLLAALLR